MSETCPACAFRPSDDGGGALAMTPVTWRTWWVLDRAPWRSTKRPSPQGWDPIAQLEQHLARTAGLAR